MCKIAVEIYKGGIFLKEKCQIIYEELCYELKDIDIEKCYYLAIMGMSRTLCLCSRIVTFDFFSDIVIISKFMEDNMKAIFAHKQIYYRYNEVCQFFDELSDNWEDYISNDCERIQDIALKSGLYEFMETWYTFLGIISDSYEHYTPEKMIFFITLPIRFLDSYLTNYFINNIDENKLQAFVNEHKAIKYEVERIFSDIQLVLNNSQDTIYKRISSYSKLVYCIIGI